MAVKKRCGFCLEVVRADGTCPNEECPRYVPDTAPEPTTEMSDSGNTETEPVTPTPTQETPSEGTATPSEGNTAPAVETPSTGEPVQSEGESATNASGGKTETANNSGKEK